MMDQAFRQMIKINIKNLLRNALAINIILGLLACNGEDVPEVKSSQNNCPAGPKNIELVDIQSVVDWINAMEKPLTLPCFIASLPRPLKVNTSASVVSAQPARGRRSPRMFFFYDDLILTVAVDQDEEENIPAELEKHLLELSFIVDHEELLTTKAELVFPVTEHLEKEEPYAHIAFKPTISICAFCHSRETLHEMIGDTPVYRSEMLKPNRSVSLGLVISESIHCDPEKEVHRCAMLSSIVKHGNIEWVEFPNEASSF